MTDTTTLKRRLLVSATWLVAAGALAPQAALAQDEPVTAEEPVAADQGGEIVVNRNGERNHAHEDVHVAIRDAFAAMARKLEGYARRQRGAVESHDTPRHARTPLR